MKRIKVDRETALPWVEVAHSSRIMQDVFSRVLYPRTGSAFEMINAAYPWDLASTWCRGYLTAAADHMVMWADYVAPLQFAPDAEVIQKFRPVQTLARAAIEAAAQAVWVMGADGPRECARRHVCLILHDLDEERRAAPDSARADVTSSRRDLLSRLSPWVSEQEIGKFPGYLEVVKQASATVARNGTRPGGINDPTEVERLWRSAAGSAHGKRWPSMKLQVVVEDSDGTVEGEDPTRYPDPSAITAIVKLADAITTYGIIRFAELGGYVDELPTLLVEAFSVLSKKIPLLEGAVAPNIDPASFVDGLQNNRYTDDAGTRY